MRPSGGNMREALAMQVSATQNDKDWLGQHTSQLPATESQGSLADVLINCRWARG